MTSNRFNFHLALVLGLGSTLFTAHAHAGTPFTIKATFENPAAPGELSLVSILPGGTILATTPHSNGAPMGSIFKIDQSGQMIHRFDGVDTDWFSDAFSRDPGTGHLYFSEPSFNHTPPRFFEFDDSLRAIGSKDMPNGYFNNGTGGAFMHAYLRNGSVVKAVSVASQNTLFLLDVQKNVLLEKPLSGFTKVKRTGDDRFLALTKQVGRTTLTTYNLTGQVVLDRSLPETNCNFVNVVDQQYPEEALRRNLHDVTFSRRSI